MTTPMLAPHETGTFWLDADPAEFRAKYERAGFAFPHRLAGNPLFALENLIELAKFLSDDRSQLVYDAGDVRVDQRWDEVPLCDMPAHALIERIETAGAWILLKHANKRPGYDEILEQCYQDVRTLSGWDLDTIVRARKSIVFLNSPHRVTSYHIDHQSTFLLQLQGTKTISIFDKTDRDVLPDIELEKFWARDDNAAIYKPALQHRATVIELGPGMGVHIPINAPHWVQNGPEVSVSMNFNFDFHERFLPADLYRSNYWLRVAGVPPLAPGRSAFVDGVKTSAFASARSMMQTLRSLRNRSTT